MARGSDDCRMNRYRGTIVTDINNDNPSMATLQCLHGADDSTARWNAHDTIPPGTDIVPWAFRFVRCPGVKYLLDFAQFEAKFVTLNLFCVLLCVWGMREKR